MLKKDNSFLMMIDMQDKLVSMLKDKADFAISQTEKLIKAAKILNIDTITTEQYPKGLGPTIEVARNCLSEKYVPYEKTSFSAIDEENIYNAAKEIKKTQAILFGIEAHICVFQTAIALKNKGWDVFVVEDATFSRNDSQKQTALQTLRHFNIPTLTVEMVIFMWLKSSLHPNFKEVQALIK